MKQLTPELLTFILDPMGVNSTLDELHDVVNEVCRDDEICQVAA